MRRFWIVVLLLLATLPISAQDDLPPVIFADNVAQLQSVQQIDFAGFDYQFDTGWFAANFDGTRYALRDTNGNAVVVYGDDQSSYSFTVVKSNSDAPAQVVDAVFFRDSVYFLSYYEGNTFVNMQRLDEIDGIPLAIGSGETGADNGFIVIEVLDSESRTSYMYEYATVPLTDHLNYSDSAPIRLLNENSEVVRVGRISFPRIVISSETGQVISFRAWLESTRADNGTGQPSVFGNINADATHFVWRDNASEILYLLDFETGENREVAQLNGEYAQWFFLSNDASAIVAVNLNFEPIVVAWDVETGEKTVLGEYRQCNRPQPDMARLSRDGTTLVIGCDTGLDVWRVVEEE